MSMLWRPAFLLGFVVSARGRSPRCTAEASLLQKQHLRSKKLLSSSHPSENEGLTYHALPGQLLAQMIMSNPWKCDFLPEWDIYRRPTCNVAFAESGLHPAHMTALGNSSCDHKNSVRMLFPIGSLPCCSTMPFCSAPACAERNDLALATSQESVDMANASSAKTVTPDTEGAQVCTKRDAHENFAYMTSSAVWPAYHGWGGSFDLDVQKHYDVLQKVLHEHSRFEPFDLVIDVGANSGVITEKLTGRSFARNYILVEAYPGMKQLFDTRLGNENWKQRWFSEQVPQRKGTQMPALEFLNFAVNSESKGSVDFCTNNMWSIVNNNVPCPVDKLALDDMIPEHLSENFRGIFATAESAYVKTDVEGMDELALQGMSRLLDEQRGVYRSGSRRYLVNFMQLEYAPILAAEWKEKEGRANYDLKTLTMLLESKGFETFLMGPKYLPLSHGSWDDSFKQFTEDPQNSWGGSQYPEFFTLACPGPECPTGPLRNVVAADLFAIRASHPKATQIKLALGACRESQEFNLADEQYKAQPA